MKYQSKDAAILVGDACYVLRAMASESVQCIVTSPPYWHLRDYGVPGQIGLSETIDGYLEELVAVFRECRRVLRHDGTLWLNLGDSYSSGNRKTYRSGALSNKNHSVQDNMPRPRTPNGLKPKDLVGIPWRVAFALQADGWYLRQDIVWSKPNPMTESVQDRCTKSHEYVFLLSKSPRYRFDWRAIAEEMVTSERERRRSKVLGRGGQQYADAALGSPHRAKSGGYPCPEGKRRKRSVWEIPTVPDTSAHCAVFPVALPTLCISAGCPVEEGEGKPIVMDPFAGTGTTGRAALSLGCRFLGIELNPAYASIAWDRLAQQMLF